MPSPPPIVVDDTRVGIQAGLNAGCWTIAVAATGNEMGLSRDELSDLTADERERRLVKIRQRFRDWGAHFVVDSAAHILPIIDGIDAAVVS